MDADERGPRRWSQTAPATAMVMASSEGMAAVAADGTVLLATAAGSRPRPGNRAHRQQTRSHHRHRRSRRHQRSDFPRRRPRTGRRDRVQRQTPPRTQPGTPHRPL